MAKCRVAVAENALVLVLGKAVAMHCDKNILDSKRMGLLLDLTMELIIHHGVT